ncbi:PepSY-associated TM helix domain-containing protein [Bosea sp. TWI1241]|uniref:PepSY-associated TM helix domain-containing protein n=1 Tax=Bosea sp. TWI1241 TaxID=3148904 RepID=UPI00320BA7E3
MLKAWLFRLHRWLALGFAVPLALLIATGAILSVEPILQTVKLSPGELTLARIDGWLAAKDPAGKARGLSYRNYDGRLTIQGVPERGNVTLDTATGLQAADGGLAGFFGASRRLHEHLLFELDWLVIGSTIAMVVLMLMGVAMGLPRLRNTLGGWHKGVAWFGLPLLIASPITGLFIAFGISLAPAGGPGGRGEEPLPLREALAIVARDKDPSQLIWLRMRGGRQLVRLNENGAFNVYSVTRAGLSETPKNWPRLIHEGNFAGIWSGALNLAISLALAGLLGTGFAIWLRRRLRPRRRDRRANPVAPPALAS